MGDIAYLIGYATFWYFFTKWTGIQFVVRFLWYKFILKEEMPSKCSNDSSSATDFQPPSWSQQSSSSEEEPF